MPNKIVIDETVSANGDTTGKFFNNGKGNVQCSGTFDGATIKLQYSVDGGVTFVDAGEGSELTAAGGYNFDLPDCHIRFNAASGGGSLAVDAKVRKVNGD